MIMNPRKKPASRLKKRILNKIGDWFFTAIGGVVLGPPYLSRKTIRVNNAKYNLYFFPNIRRNTLEVWRLSKKFFSRAFYNKTKSILKEIESFAKEKGFKRVMLAVDEIPARSIEKNAPEYKKIKPPKGRDRYLKYYVKKIK